MKRLLRSLRPSHALAFALGILFSHFLGFSRHAEAPQWLTIATYIIFGFVMLCLLASIYRSGRRIKEMDRRG
jgi:4-hydroxybenzoate polyprenyltransferase